MHMRPFRGLSASLFLLALCATAQAQTKVTLIETSKSWGTAIADYDNDGHDDIYITGHDTDDRIWYWTPNGYRRSAQSLELRIHSDRHDCAPADVDLDGRMDFYCAVGATQGTGTGDNELWIQQPDGSHRMVGLDGDFGAKDPTGRGRRPIFFDMNRDGLPDIFLTNLGEARTDGLPNLNRVYLNRGAAQFEEILTTATGLFGSTCVAKGDIDQDGWDDIVVCSDSGPPHLYLNTRANDFVEIPPPGVLAATSRAQPGVRPAGRVGPQDIQEGPWVDAKLADMDGDGRDDLLVITRSSKRLQVWKNSGTGAYFDTLLIDDALPGIGTSLAVGDFNHDGVKDVYVVLQNARCASTRLDQAPDLLYESRGAGQWVAQALRQKFSGCGHLADVLDGDKVLLMNGDGRRRGPSYVLEFAGTPN